MVKKLKTGLKHVKLSADLAAVLESDQMARRMVLKKLWAVIKKRKLQDPNDPTCFSIKNQPDLKKVFAAAGSDRINGFGMMKYLKPHINNL